MPDTLVICDDSGGPLSSSLFGNVTFNLDSGETLLIVKS